MSLPDEPVRPIRVLIVEDPPVVAEGLAPASARREYPNSIASAFAIQAEA